MERVFIIIDGSNFYHRLKELKLQRLLGFDYGKFARHLVGKRKVVTKRYYIGAIREETGNPKSKELRRSQRILVGQLRKYGWRAQFGNMLKNGGYHFSHKPSMGLITNSDVRRLFTADDLEQFLTQE